jgi:hypothetical protein
MQLSPPSSHSIPLWSKYSPQHPVLKHPQFMFLSYCQYIYIYMKAFAFDSLISESHISVNVFLISSVSSPLGYISNYEIESQCPRAQKNSHFSKTNTISLK